MKKKQKTISNKEIKSEWMRCKLFEISVEGFRFKFKIYSILSQNDLIYLLI